MQAITTLAVGHITHDRFSDKTLPGGCAYYAARTFKALGARSRLVTVVGQDFACEDAFEDLQTRVQRSGKTTVFTNLYPNSGPRVQYIDAMAPPVSPDQLPLDWRHTDAMFLGPVIDEVDIPAWKKAIDARIVAIGVQGYVRTKEESRKVVPCQWSPKPEELKCVDVACLSEEDLVGQGDLLDRLREHVPLVALTRERKGCDIIQRERSTWIGIHPASEVDPTGAGDTFAAGFLFGLAQGKEPIEAARLGASCASIIIEGLAGEAFARMGAAFERAKHI